MNSCILPVVISRKKSSIIKTYKKSYSSLVDPDHADGRVAVTMDTRDTLTPGHTAFKIDRLYFLTEL